MILDVHVMYEAPQKMSVAVVQPYATLNKHPILNFKITINFFQKMRTNKKNVNLKKKLQKC